MDLDGLVAEGIFTASMSLHTAERDAVWAAWAGLRFWPDGWPHGWPLADEFAAHKDKWPLTIKPTPRRALPDMGLLQQPIHAIRAYFGSKIAFYFAWAETYTCWLLWTILLMLPTEVCRRAIEDPAVDAYLQVAYCVLMGVMSTFLNEFWVNKRTALAHIWDVADIKQELRPRPEYLRSAHEGRWRLEEHGGSAKHGISKLHGFWAEGGIFVEDQNEGAQLVMSTKDRTRVNMIGTAILIALCTAAVISTLTILTLQMLWATAHQFDGTFLRDHGGLLGSLMITAQVVIMNVLYKKLAVFLTDVANHRTEDAYEDAVILKVP